MENPQIYVACLAAYNSGIFHGQWINANQSAICIHDAIQEMLIKSPIQKAEEWAIHDYDGFGTIKLHENESLETVAEYAEFIAVHGDLGLAVLENFDIETASTMLDEHYHGVYDSEVDFAWYLFEECYSNDIPENLKYYFDYAAFARDLFISDYFSVEVDGLTYVFLNA